MNEIEIKLALAPQDEAAFVRARALAGATPSRTRLVSIYFDTPDLALAREEMALRLRRAGRRWVQSLKAGRSGTGGLHARGEWEYPQPRASVDLALFAETPLAQLAQAASLHETLREIFRVEMTRTHWYLEPIAGTRLEIALDRGWVRSGARAEPISEVEIEVIAGEPTAAFELARALIEEVPLRPSATSKAQRGYRLARAERPRPVKAADIELDTGMTPRGASRRIIGTALDQLQANEEGLLEAADAEFVHQARVALRRMRSALRMFREPIGAERAQAWRDALGALGQALGAARDWDVFALESLPPALAAFGDPAEARRIKRRAAQRRHVEREGARAAIRSPAYARTILDVAQWLHSPEAAGVDAVALRDFASAIVRRRHKRLIRDAARLETLGPAERHRLRIDAKRLRYGVDAMASLFPEKRVGRYLDLLVALQDALGNANDAITALRLLKDLAPDARFATFAEGWFGALARGDPVLFDVLVASLRETRRFWRRAKAPDVVQS